MRGDSMKESASIQSTLSNDCNIKLVGCHYEWEEKYGLFDDIAKFEETILCEFCAAKTDTTLCRKFRIGNNAKRIFEKKED